MDQPRKLRVNRWDVHKLCPEHGLRYLFIADHAHPAQTGMCAHPTCLEKMVTATEKYPLCGRLVKFARKLDRDRGAPGAFTDFVVEQLLHGAKKGKITVMNPTFMRFAALNYLTILRREEDKMKKLQDIRNELNSLLEEEAGNLLEGLSSGGFSFVSVTGRTGESPERALAHKEVVEITIEEWGVETYLWLWGELTDLDYVKISKCAFKDLPEIKKSYKKWYRRLTNQDFSDVSV